MRSTTTISLPAKLQREVAKAARRNQMTLSEYVRKAIQDKLWEDAFDETRRKLLPRAQAMGIYTDEDVFKRVS
jgi:metal-responsive CopG/Arc/MetJ family transcriptional regulator